MTFLRRPNPPVAQDGLWLVVGLGNPGVRFEGTRHNIGFMVVERIASERGIRFTGSKFRADIARAEIGGTQVLLVMPETFMNESGIAVGKAASYYRVPPDRILVISDDMDLPFGTIRLRPGGSAGGQRGLLSVISSLGTDAFPRLRVGIGRPPGNAINYVLQPFSLEERQSLPEILDVSARAVEAIIRDGALAAMNTFNRNWLASEA